MRVLLDTSLLVGEQAPRPADEVHAISVVSIAEIHFGVGIARTATARMARLRRLGEVEALFDALPVDEHVAREYGRLATLCVERGATPRRRAFDLLIAATANVHDAALATADDDLQVLGDAVRLIR